eukprot:5790175-Amphidinium_carterae.1
MVEDVASLAGVAPALSWHASDPGDPSTDAGDVMSSLGSTSTGLAASLTAVQQPCIPTVKLRLVISQALSVEVQHQASLLHTIPQHKFRSAPSMPCWGCGSALYSAFAVWARYPDQRQEKASLERPSVVPDALRDVTPHSASSSGAD